MFVQINKKYCTETNREEAVAKANALKERNEKEKKQYLLEINELSRIIRHEEKLLDFMHVKNKGRHFLETDDERQSMCSFYSF